MSNCLLLGKCLDQCMVDPKSCKPKALPYLNKHIGLLKSKKKKKDLGKIWKQSARLTKKKKANLDKTYACSNILNHGLSI